MAYLLALLVVFPRGIDTILGRFMFAREKKKGRTIALLLLRRRHDIWNVDTLIGMLD